MNISEKAAYFKGLVEGTGLDRDSREGKLWSALSELLVSITEEIGELQDSQTDFADTLDEIGDELSYLEEITCDLDEPEDYDDYDCDGDCYSCSGCCDEGEDDILPFSDYAEASEAEGSSEGEAEDEELDYDIVYDVTCPACGEEISFGEDTLEVGYIVCPKCGERLEFDFSEEE